MPNCLFITKLADEFLAESRRISQRDMQATACKSAQEALDRYDGEEVLFGDPQMIASVLSEMPEVRWVQSSWAGVTPLVEHVRRDYQLTGVKGVFGTQMAEFTLGYMLANELRVFERRIKQQEATWYQAPSGTLRGKRLGIMGTGSIGRDIAGMAVKFGMEVHGLNRSGAEAANFSKVYAVDVIGEFLASLDYLVATLPQTPETDDLLTATTLTCLPPHAYFINVGRSNVVASDALVDCLQEGRLSGAVLDVFDQEPLPADSPFWRVPNLLVTAHIAAISHPLLIVPIFVDNYRRYVDDEPLQNKVDFVAGY